MAMEMAVEMPVVANDTDDLMEEAKPTEIAANASGDGSAFVVPSAECDKIVMVEEVQSLEQFLMTLKGFTERDVDAFKFQGIHTVQQLRCTLSKDIFLVDLPEEKVEQAIIAVKKQKCKTTAYGFVTALTVREQRRNMPRISTGSKQLDQILGGGVEASSLTEFFGEFCCGKTQLCHTMAVIAQLPPQHGGNNGRVLYLDTEGTFRPERIHQIASARGLPPDSVMENILVARAINSEHLMELLVEAAGHLCSSEEQFALIVVDSIMAGFRVDYKNDEIMLRQMTLARVLAKLQKLSEEFKVAVVLINHVSSQGGDKSAGSFVKSDPKPIGGHVIAHASTTRVALRKGANETKIAKIYDSPYLPEGESTFIITDHGISDFTG
eukprot:GEMP01029056.1.p1 GENE.GEMP01029056.1~~GEMP01029056.1.p1  ORF type:complete len:381 (+),score=109.45 GEMP01029056.1:114-1256(+)